jgi:hypothetical protein
MNTPLDATIIQSLVVLIAILIVFAIIGLRTGWRGQVVILGLIISLWGLFSIAGDLLVKLANNAYMGFLFLVQCAIMEDPFTCLESSGIMQKILVTPQDAEQVRLLFLSIFVFTLLPAYLLVVRFGKAPRSILQKLIGLVTGIVSGLILSYLLIPFTPTQIPLLPGDGLEEDLPQIAEYVPELSTVCQVSVPFIVLVLFVLFVLVAVRFIRPTKAQS